MRRVVTTRCCRAEIAATCSSAAQEATGRWEVLTTTFWLRARPITTQSKPYLPSISS